MDLTDIGLFSLAEKRMAWIDQRQSVLAQNIANANTPAYKAQDLSPFSAVLAGRMVPLMTTAPNQIGGSGQSARLEPTRSDGKSPNGNTVVTEDELGKIANTSSDQELVANLYRKYADLFRKVVVGANG